MSRSSQLQVSRTRNIPVPNEYILALSDECVDFAYDEERAPTFRGRWREDAFASDADQPLDLEIGTGNGTHFAHRAALRPERRLIGIELKYKPLIQTIRRARRMGASNARVARYNASLVHQMFAPGELNDVFIFFPDPWERQRQKKHRLIQDEFLVRLFECQRAGSSLTFKTDSRVYFEYALERFARSSYRMVECERDLHAATRVTDNFVTQFERIFVSQGVPIGYAKFARD